MVKRASSGVAKDLKYAIPERIQREWQRGLVCAQVGGVITETVAKF